MAQQTLNDGVSFGEQRSKINSNFTELYSTKTTNSNAAITGGSITGITDLAVADGGTGASDAAGARANLGFGSIATQNSDNVNIDGGSIDGTAIGGSAPAAGSFTTLSATGHLSTAGIREDASGNLGLGVTPSAWVGRIASQVYSVSLASASGSPGIGEMSTNRYLATGGTDRYIYNAHAMVYQQDSGAHKWFTAPSGTAGNAIAFTQAMTLDASGNLLVGTTNIGSAVASGGAQIYTHAYGYGKTVVDIGHIVGTENGTGFQRYFYNGIAIGSVTQNGTTSVSYNTTSDHRLKTNIRPANAGRFMEIEFVDFEWVDGRHDCGVIAHQLASVYPDLVLGEKDATGIRQVEISPAIPAVTEQVLITEAVLNDDGEEVEPAVYETVEVTPAVDAVFEEQEFPVYQQVNYIGLIGRMGTRLQAVIRENEELKAQMASVLERLDALESA